MEVKLAIKKFEQDTMPKFSVYQKDKTFGAKGIIIITFQDHTNISCHISTRKYSYYMSQNIRIAMSLLVFQIQIMDALTLL